MSLISKLFLPFSILIIFSCNQGKDTVTESFEISKSIPADKDEILFHETKGAGFVPPELWFESECIIKSNGQITYKYKKINTPEVIINKSINIDLINDIKELIENVVEYELVTTNNIGCHADGPTHETKVLTSKAKYEFIHQIVFDTSSGCNQINLSCEGNSTDKLYEIINDKCKI